MRTQAYITAILATLAMSCGGAKTTTRDATQVPTSSLTRDEAIAIMRALEADPLADVAPQNRERVFAWVVSDPSLRGMAIDGRYLERLEESDYPFAGELLMQFAFGMAMYRLSPEGVEADHEASVEAGLRSVIAAYRNMAQADTKLGDRFLDDLDQIRRLGRLREYVRKVDEQNR